MRSTWKRTAVGTVLAAAALLGTGACASGGGSPAPPYASLVVVNDSHLTVNVFAVLHSIRYRLGTIASNDRVEFTLKRHMLANGQELRVMIDPIGSPETYFSDRVTVWPDDVIEMQVGGFIR